MTNIAGHQVIVKVLIRSENETVNDPELVNELAAESSKNNSGMMTDWPKKNLLVSWTIKTSRYS